MKALIIGATGATGKDLVDELLWDNDYETVTIFVRKATGKQHSKLIEHVVDFSRPDDYVSLIVGDVLFSCLGTTLKVAGSKEKQWKIDFDIPLKFAELARQNNVSTFVLVSALGASAKSKIFYSRMKGELEDRILGLDFKKCIIFRPGLLERPDTDRLGEKFALNILGFFNGLGMFRKHRPLPTRILAQKLAKAPKSQPEGITYIEKDKIFSF